MLCESQVILGGQGLWIGDHVVASRRCGWSEAVAKAHERLLDEVEAEYGEEEAEDVLPGSSVDEGERAGRGLQGGWPELAEEEKNVPEIEAVRPLAEVAEDGELEMRVLQLPG